MLILNRNLLFLIFIYYRTNVYYQHDFLFHSLMLNNFKKVFFILNSQKYGLTIKFIKNLHFCILFILYRFKCKPISIFIYAFRFLRFIRCIMCILLFICFQRSLYMVNNIKLLVVPVLLFQLIHLVL